MEEVDLPVPPIGVGLEVMLGSTEKVPMNPLETRRRSSIAVVSPLKRGSTDRQSDSLLPRRLSYVEERFGGMISTGVGRRGSVERRTSLERALKRTSLPPYAVRKSITSNEGIPPIPNRRKSLGDEAAVRRRSSEKVIDEIELSKSEPEDMSNLRGKPELTSCLSLEEPDGKLSFEDTSGRGKDQNIALKKSSDSRVTLLAPRSPLNRSPSNALLSSFEKGVFALSPRSPHGELLAQRSRSHDLGYVRKPSFVSQPRTPPIASLGQSLVVNSPVPRELTILWNHCDIHGKGYLTYEEVGGLLTDLGVEMDDWKEMEFYHTIDTDRNGQITFKEFVSGFLKFKQSGQFRAIWSSVRLAAGLAIRDGVTRERIVEVWQQYDSDGEDELDQKAISSVLSELGISHSQSELEEFFLEFDYDDSGKLSFDEFMGIFADNTQSTEEHLFECWMGEVRAVIAARKMQTLTRYQTKIQQQRDAADNRKRFFEGWYLIFLFLYAQLNILVPTYELAFILHCGGVTRYKQYQSLERIIFPISDLIVYLWLCMKFDLPKENKGAAVYESSEIRIMHLKSFEFFTDLLTALPLDLLAGIVNPKALLHPAFRLNKLLMLIHINKTFSRCFSSALGPTWWRIVNALYWWALLAHLVACAFQIIADISGDDHTKVMLTVAGYSQLPNSHRYLQAYSYAINTMAGLSRGTFPQHDTQLLFALVTVIIGVFVYALVLSVVSYSLQMKTQTAKFNAQIDEIKDFFSAEIASGRLPKGFSDEVIMYHKHVFHSTGQFHIDEDLLADLPVQLSVGVALVTGKNTIAKVPIFSDAKENDEFVYAVQQCLELIVSPPNFDIIELGTEGREMYFIASGSCCVVDCDGDIVHQMSSGDFFGEIALIASVPRTATIRTSTFCNLMELRRDQFDLVMTSFPELSALIEEKAKDRIKVIRRSVMSKRQSRAETQGNDSPLHSPTITAQTSLGTKALSSEDDDAADADADSDPEDLLAWIRNNSRRQSTGSLKSETSDRSKSRRLFGSRSNPNRVSSAVLAAQVTSSELGSPVNSITGLMYAHGLYSIVFIQSLVSYN